ncbi:hypothetical protein [Sphingobacterium prati]|uniref:hypothetical protein n=1 Tax=Sphingobacterium prati TaxID=2737006 RepID=UPI0015520353|nr:hypothetical protein [Sphingobacterium prati]NPE46707.1 hypothetical protein [Sphingobacterium prati]
MGKITDHDVAALIARRIVELIDLTGLPLEGLANFTGLSFSTLRSALKKSSSLSIDSFARLCTPLSISLSDFFNPKKQLPPHTKDLPNLVKFKVIFLSSFEQPRHKERPGSKPDGINADLRHQRKFLAQLIYSSDYFLTARTIDQIAIDLEVTHHIVIRPERLYALLKKYVGLELLEKKVLPRTARKPDDSRRPYLYYKKGA